MIAYAYRDHKGICFRNFSEPIFESRVECKQRNNNMSPLASGRGRVGRAQGLGFRV